MHNQVSRIIRKQHQTTHGHDKWKKESVEPVPNKKRRPFFFQALHNKKSPDQKHKGHKKNIVEVFENIETDPTFTINDRMGRKDISMRIKTRKSCVSQGRVMCNDEYRYKRAEIINP